METLTIILFCSSLLLFVAASLAKKNRNLLTMDVILSVCGIAAVLRDDSIGDDLMVLSILPLFLTFVLSLIMAISADTGAKE